MIMQPFVKQFNDPLCAYRCECLVAKMRETHHIPIVPFAALNWIYDACVLTADFIDRIMLTFYGRRTFIKSQLCDE